MNLLEFKEWRLDEQEDGTLVVRCPCRYVQIYRQIYRHKDRFNEPYYFHLKHICSHVEVPKEIMVTLKLMK